jgi:predicted alpha/beta-hydrolase family hydrolase
VPKCEIGKARALIARFEAGLRAQRKQRKQKGRKGQGRLLPSKAGKQAAAGVRATGQTQEKKRRGRPRKQA